MHVRARQVEVLKCVCVYVCVRGKETLQTPWCEATAAAPVCCGDGHRSRRYSCHWETFSSLYKTWIGANYGHFVDQ